MTDFMHVDRIMQRAKCPRLPADCDVARDTGGEFVIDRGRTRVYLRFNSPVNDVRAAAILLRAA